jgi:peptidoglycan/LPS O-acetylase OafA/YrhL
MRDRTIDGFRAMAALGVVVAHAVSYRYAYSPVPGLHYLQRLADPLSQTSVQVFFVISGYIITTLLLNEERSRGRITIPAFYVRRVCRIIPPLIVLFATIMTARSLGLITLDDASLISSATFTCNLGIVDCSWWVAHTWSLAVEEQFYLFWPMILVLLPQRSIALALTVSALLIISLFRPLVAHSNFISFSCIGIGAFYATCGPVRAAITRISSGLLWVGAVCVLLLGPLYVPEKPMQAAMPILILYVIFAGRELALVRLCLGVKPVQLVGLGSYSLYLWQQLFLAKPELYHEEPFAVWLLPLVVAASVILVEQPFIRLGRRLSTAISGRIQEIPSTVMPAP